VRADDFDALVIPGGYSPDKLRTSRPMVAFTRAFFDQGKLVAAVCHAPWMLVEADAAEGRTVTSWPSIRTDLINAGARWVDAILRRLADQPARPARDAPSASPDAAAPR
jgi:protease I